MNLSFYTALVALFFHTVCLAQPGPEVFFPLKMERITDAITKDPDNDSLRLARIRLFYQEDKSMTKPEIDYLYGKFKAGTNTVALDDLTFCHLYGDCYAYSNPRLALSYYRKAANIRPTEYLYTLLFNGHYKLRNADTALLYYDTLMANSGFQFKKFDDDHLTFNKIELMNDSRAYNPELAAFYTYLSRIYFNKYREQSLKNDFKEQDYENTSMLETGFAYQFDLCAYYLRWQKQQEAKDVLEKLEKHTGKNSLGGPIELHK